MLILFLSIFTFYISFRIGLDIYESIFIKEEVEKSPILMSKMEYIDAGLYAVYQKIIDIFDAFASLFVVVVLLFGGLWLINYFDNGNSLLTIVIYFAILYLISLPIDIYRKIIDTRFGFNRGSWKLFIVDNLKKIAIFILVAVPIFYLLIYFIENFKEWWLIGALFTFFIVVLINLSLPYFMKLFNKFTPLENEELKDRIEEIMEKVGFKSDGVFIMDASKRDSRLNAFFGGFGKSKRVVLFDTLIEKLNSDEIVAVLGHELGHFREKHLIKNIVMIGLMLFGLFFIIGHLPDSLFEELKVPKNGGNILVISLLVGEVYFYLVTPIFNYFSRRNEFEADAYALETTEKPEPLISMLKGLAASNLSHLTPHPLMVFLSYSHPPVSQRITAVQTS